MNTPNKNIKQFVIYLKMLSWKEKESQIKDREMKITLYDKLNDLQLNIRNAKNLMSSFVAQLTRYEHDWFFSLINMYE